MSEPARKQMSAGGVLVRTAAAGYDVCLILRARHQQRTWGLPKGHPESGEDIPTAARREVEEETGLIGAILAPLGFITYAVRDPSECPPWQKTVHFFLMKAVGGTLGARDTQETLEARWVAFDDALTMAAYEGEREVLTRAQRALADPALAQQVAA